MPGNVRVLFTSWDDSSMNWNMSPTWMITRLLLNDNIYINLLWSKLMSFIQGMGGFKGSRNTYFHFVGVSWKKDRRKTRKTWAIFRWSSSKAILSFKNAFQNFYWLSFREVYSCDKSCKLPTRVVNCEEMPAFLSMALQRHILALSNGCWKLLTGQNTK